MGMARSLGNRRERKRTVSQPPAPDEIPSRWTGPQPMMKRSLRL